MISRQFLREHPEAVREAIEDKGVEGVNLDRALEVDASWRELKARGDELRHERNEVSGRIGELKAAGKEIEAEEAISRSQDLKAELGDIEAEADELEAELEAALLTLPQIPHESVPVGEDESDNEELRRENFADRHELPDLVVPHYEIGEELGIIDEGRARKTSGSGFYFLRGDGAQLEHALIQFMLDVHREQGYLDVFPPVPVSSDAMTGTGQLPKFAADAYRLGHERGGEGSGDGYGNDDGDSNGNSDDEHEDTTSGFDAEDLWLCPTAEVPVTNMHREEILLDEDLPLKYQAYTPNFRREAGEHGTETRGIVRVHQFNKVELVNFARPEESYDRLEGLLDEAEEVLRRLGLPYRILLMCTGDMGFPQAKKYDVEVWAPGDDMPDGPEEGGRWLEVSSVSNFEAFQARRARIQYRPERHESAEYLHTLNGSGVAVPRVMVAVMEYYQDDDGTITVPDALRPYMGGQELIEGHDPVGESAVGAGRRD
jgi:seryl-tRNA synthetase